MVPIGSYQVVPYTRWFGAVPYNMNTIAGHTAPVQTWCVRDNTTGAIYGTASGYGADFTFNHAGHYRVNMSLTNFAGSLEQYHYTQVMLGAAPTPTPTPTPTPAVPAGLPLPPSIPFYSHFEVGADVDGNITHTAYAGDLMRWGWTVNTTYFDAAIPGGIDSYEIRSERQLLPTTSFHYGARGITTTPLLTGGNWSAVQACGYATGTYQQMYGNGTLSHLDADCGIAFSYWYPGFTEEAPFTSSEGTFTDWVKPVIKDNLGNYWEVLVDNTSSYYNEFDWLDPDFTLPAGTNAYGADVPVVLSFNSFHSINATYWDGYKIYLYTNTLDKSGSAPVIAYSTTLPPAEDALIFEVDGDYFDYGIRNSLYLIAYREGSGSYEFPQEAAILGHEIVPVETIAPSILWTNKDGSPITKITQKYQAYFCVDTGSACAEDDIANATVSIEKFNSVTGLWEVSPEEPSPDWTESARPAETGNLHAYTKRMVGSGVVTLEGEGIYRAVLRGVEYDTGTTYELDVSPSLEVTRNLLSPSEAADDVGELLGISDGGSTGVASASLLFAGVIIAALVFIPMIIFRRADPIIAGIGAALGFVISIALGLVPMWMLVILGIIGVAIGALLFTGKLGGGGGAGPTVDPNQTGPSEYT